MAERNGARKVREELSKTALAKCHEAIERGEMDEAKAQATAIWEEGRPLHDMYVDMSGLMATYVRDKLGDEAVEDMWRVIGEQVWKPLLMAMKETGSTDALVDAYAMFLRAHGHDFTVYEDDEKTSFVMHFCASGGMLMRDGKNQDSERHAMNIGVTETIADWTFDRPLSVYCVHTPLWMDILPREWGWDVFKSTFGRQFDDQGNPVDDPCVAMIYKQPQS